MGRAWKQLMLIAVLLMPFGITAAPAAAVQHHSASMPIPHCPEQSSKHNGKAPFVECTMTCSDAVPAADLSEQGPPQFVYDLVEPVLARPLHGLHPDTVTPPPKLKAAI
jgi:hypothetical protein